MIFVDSSNVSEIKEFVSWGICAGVTTNPLILLKDNPNVDLEKTIKEICEVLPSRIETDDNYDLIKSPVSVELVSTNYDDMMAEALRYREWDSSKIVIKVPVTPTGLKVISSLSAKNIPTNATCIMSLAQAILASTAGATYVSFFVGRISDMGYDPFQIMKDYRATWYSAHSLAASLRSVEDVRQSLMSGCSIQTIQPHILRKMIQNPRTDSTIEEFNNAWATRK